MNIGSLRKEELMYQESITYDPNWDVPNLFSVPYPTTFHWASPKRRTWPGPPPWTNQTRPVLTRDQRSMFMCISTTRHSTRQQSAFDSISVKNPTALHSFDRTLA